MAQGDSAKNDAKHGRDSKDNPNNKKNGKNHEAGTWRKPSRSFSNGNCVEVAEDWRKSRQSKSGNCVEVASGVAVRDTQDREGPVLKFSAAVWRAFTAALDTGKHEGKRSWDG